MEKRINDLLKKYTELRFKAKEKEREELEKGANSLMDLWYGGQSAGYQQIIRDLEKLLNDIKTKQI